MICMKPIGRPKTSVNQFNEWADLLRPFLTKGISLYSSIEKAGLSKHQDSIYRNLKLNSEFCEKIHHFQSYPGEVVMNIYFHAIERIHNKVLAGLPLTGPETSIVCHFSTHNRSCDNFFFQASRYTRRNVTPPQPNTPIKIVYVVPKMETVSQNQPLRISSTSENFDRGNF